MDRKRKRSDGEEASEGAGSWKLRNSRTLKVLPVTGGLLVEIKLKKDENVTKTESGEVKARNGDGESKVEVPNGEAKEYADDPMKLESGEKGEREEEKKLKEEDEEHIECRATAFGALYRRCTKETRSKVKEKERVVSSSKERRGQTPAEIRREAMRKLEVEVEKRKVNVGRLKDMELVEVAGSGDVRKVEVTPQERGAATPRPPPPPGKGRDGAGRREEEQGGRRAEQRGRREEQGGRREVLGRMREEQGSRRAPYLQLFPDRGLGRKGGVPLPPHRLPAPPPLHHSPAPPPLHHSPAPLPPRHESSSIPRTMEQLERRLAWDSRVSR